MVAGLNIDKLRSQGEFVHNPDCSKGKDRAIKSTELRIWLLGRLAVEEPSGKEGIKMKSRIEFSVEYT